MLKTLLSEIYEYFNNLTTLIDTSERFSQIYTGTKEE